MKVGVRTTPKLVVSEDSGFRAGFPPFRTSHWLAGHVGILQYSAGVTPVRAHWAAVAFGAAPEQGSDPLKVPTVTPPNNSSMFGARTAWLKLARSLKSGIGAYSRA